MYNPIKVLVEEHDLLLHAVNTARQIQLIKDNELYHNKVHDIILFFRNFTEMYHYPKEDGILYPVLKNYTTGISPGLISELTNNHEDLDQLLADIIDAHVSHEYVSLRVALNKYLNELTEQVETESNTILKNAEHLLSEQEAHTIFYQFAELDRRDGTKETLHKRYHSISV